MHNRDREAQTIREGEKQWHEKLFASRNGGELLLDPAIRDRYLKPPDRPLFHREEMFRLAGELDGKKVLVFGCGDDNSTVILALKGAEVWAFDLSEEAVELQRRMAIANGVQDRVHLVVCAAEELPFAASHFDLVFGSAILHHVPNHLAAVSEELERIVKPDGRALFAEPLIRSSMMQAILSRLPRQAMSPGERPLTNRDLDAFGARFHLTYSYFTFLARLDRFLLTGPLEHASWLLTVTVYGLHMLDHLLLNVMRLNRLAGAAVILMRPKTSFQLAPATAVEVQAY